MTDRDDLPAPNPPQATTDQLRRELGLLQTEMDRRLVSAATLTDEKVKGTAGRVDKSTEALTGQIDVLRQRLDDMDRANAVLNETVTRVPTDVQREVQHLRELMFSSTGSLEKQVTEKFAAIGQQFAERDVRTEQSSTAANQALNAALQAAKELVGAQGEASAAAAVKSETSFALALDTPIFTADGWKTMGTVKAGEIVFAEDGEPTSVIATSGVFLDSSCYTVQFSDGSRIVATGDHRWHVRAWQGKREDVWKTLTTQEIVDSGWHRSGDGYRYHVRKVVPFGPSTTRQSEWASITDVQSTPTVPTRCLTVEHPSHVFLVGRGFIPTCNTKQIDQIGTIIQTLEKALDARITELKERIDRGEGNTSGARVQQDDSRAITAESTAKRSSQIAIAAVVVSVFVLLIAAASLIYAVTRQPITTTPQSNLSCSVAASGMTCVKP